MIWLALGIITGLWLVTAGSLLYVVRNKVEDQNSAHAKCVAHIASVTSNRVVAIAFRDAANRWDSIEEQADLKRLAREQYKPGGPSMPALWLRQEANRIEGLTQ